MLQCISKRHPETDAHFIFGLSSFIMLSALSISNTVDFHCTRDYFTLYPDLILTSTRSTPGLRPGFHLYPRCFLILLGVQAWPPWLTWSHPPAIPHPSPSPFTSPSVYFLRIFLYRFAYLQSSPDSFALSPNIDRLALWRLPLTFTLCPRSHRHWTCRISQFAPRLRFPEVFPAVCRFST